MGFLVRTASSSNAVYILIAFLPSIILCLLILGITILINQRNKKKWQCQKCGCLHSEKAQTCNVCGTALSVKLLCPENKNPYSMRWFAFFTKVRPWILVLGSLSTLSLYFNSASSIVSVVAGLGNIFDSILSVMVFFKANRVPSKELLDSIKSLLIFESIFYPYSSFLFQYKQETDLLPIVIVFVVGVGLSFLFWYHFNMFYFKKRLSPFVEQEDKQYEEYNNYVHLPTIETVAVVPEKVCFCRKCGEKLLDGSRFCRKCGTEVIEIDENHT